MSELLSEEQAKKLTELKIATRIENERYLRSHPEIALMLREFSKAVLTHKPEDIPAFAAGECAWEPPRSAATDNTLLHADFFSDEELPDKMSKISGK
eukprot:m.119829 g.119829  ORF g.119829 m.119829 type:complete len:97 (-) comp9565_c0_seq1:1893-2183(-)